MWLISPDSAWLMSPDANIDKLLKFLAGFLKTGIIVCAAIIVLLFIFGEKMVIFAATFLDDVPS